LFFVIGGVVEEGYHKKQNQRFDDDRRWKMKRKEKKEGEGKEDDGERK
jgi:hypothetical protein